MRLSFAKQTILYVMKWSLLSLGLVLCVLSSPLCADVNNSYTVQAVRTLNFARFTEWSSSSLADADNVINLCVLGEPLVQNAFSQIEKKPAGGKLIKVFHLTLGNSFDQCKVLYMSGLDRNETKAVLRELKKLPILTISDDRNFIANKGMVQLLMDEGLIDVIVNLKAVRQAGLVINSRVLRLAEVVYR